MQSSVADGRQCGSFQFLVCPDAEWNATDMRSMPDTMDNSRMRVMEHLTYFWGRCGTPGFEGEAGKLRGFF
jgi:hypothetical protein